MTVLATLHQPRNSIMRCFEDMMVLAGGRVIYQGTVKNYTHYLSNVVRVRIPAHESPYDLLLDVLNPAIADESAIKSMGLANKSVDVGTHLATIFDKSYAGRAVAKSKRFPSGEVQRSKRQGFLLARQRIN